jgi:hypothetical protein
MLLLCVTVVGRDSAPAAAPTKKPLKAGEFNPAHETVEMFDAIKAGQIDVRLIHKDSSGGKALISNKSGKPLNVKLPDAFAGVHVLAQMNGGQGMGIGGGMGQMSGGGMGGGGMGGGGMGGMGGGGGGMFNVAPEKVGEVPFTSVCLEHGKPEPRASMTYQIRAIDSVTKNKDLVEVLRLLNRGTMSQRVAQVLAWHLNNEMSFEELAAKRIEHLDGSSEPYFQLEEIRAAMAAKDYVAKQIAEREAAATTALPKL